MSLGNATDRYGAVAKTFHWITALGIFANLALGFAAEWAPRGTEGEIALKTALFSAHKTVGVAVFFVALLRILWALAQPKPAPLHPERRTETLTADTVHWLLYGSLVLVPLSGWIGHAASEGFARIWWPFGQSLPLVPKSSELAETAWTLHYVFMLVLVASIVLHVAGAVKHHVVDKDATLRRMLPGTTRAASPDGRHGIVLPFVLALAFWGVALAGGAAAGLFSGPEGGESAALEDVDSEWEVQDGTLAIVVQQMGSEVRGEFADWTADIAFTPRDEPGPAGEVTVQIAVPSLTLGSVTSEAKAPAYLAAEEHPTATFAAEILREADGWVADGTVTLKGQEAPVTMPFELTLDGDTAEMRGTATLDRRNYEVGQSMDSEDTVGFEIGVQVELTAVRASE